MDWSFLKLKKTDTASSDGTPPPFFNVMPKAVVQEPVLEPSVHPVAAAAAPRAALPQPVTWAAPKASTAPTIASLLTPQGAGGSYSGNAAAAPATVDHVPNLPPRGWQVLGGVFALLFAFAAIWYAYSTFGGGTQIFDGIEKLWKRVPPIVEKKPNISEAAPNATPTAQSAQSTAAWRVEHFGSADCAECGDDKDADADGATNGVEFSTQTDPKNADTDGDGLADGDEIAIFLCDPTTKFTAKNELYTDADYMKGGWDCVFSAQGDVRLGDARKAQIVSKIKEVTLHEPSIKTLGSAVAVFGMPAPTPSQSSVPGGATTAEMKLEHDTERVTTIKKVAAALVAHKQQLGGYPQVSSFSEMAQKIKPFLGDVGNVVDPVNIRPMTYEYQLNQNGNSFLLSYYSETQQQIVRYTESKALLEGGAADAKARDAQRTKDLEKIRAALLIYSTATAAASEAFAFPLPSQVEAKLSPQYIATVPRDPLTKQLYSYEVSDDGSTFTLKALYEKPAAGKTGYLCNQEECRSY